MSIQIQKVTDKSFRKYGRILTGEYDVAELMTAMEKTECPDDAVIYIPSDKEIEKLPVMKSTSSTSVKFSGHFTFLEEYSMS